MGWYGVLGVAGAYYGAVRLWSGRIVVIIVEEKFSCVLNLILCFRVFM